MPPAQPYRDAPPAPAQPAHELFVPWRDDGTRAAFGKIIAGLVLGTMTVTAVALVAPRVALAFAVALAVWLVWSWRAGRSSTGVKLRVSDGVLEVVPPAGEPTLRWTLSSLVNVEIESKEVRHLVVEQQVGAPMMTTTVTPAVDVGRIAFVPDGGVHRVYLAEAFASYSHCTEWTGRVRVFLRRAGWIPADERVATRVEVAPDDEEVDARESPPPAARARG